MYTQCPHCQTLFRISSEQLRTAGGKARCCQCHEVFNALEGLREALTGSKPKAEPEQDELFSDTLNLDESQLYDPPNESPEEITAEPPSDDLIWEQNDGLESEPAYLAMGSESQMSDLLDPDSTASSHTPDVPTDDIYAVPLSEQTDSADPDRHTGPAPGDEEDALPATREPVATRPQAEQHDSVLPAGEDARDEFGMDEMFSKGPAPWASMLWGIGGLLLLGLLALQIVWSHRDRVVQHPYGEQFLQTLCQVAKCDAPQRRDLSRIEIEHRDLRAHPQQQGALLLQLGMINRADFDQPYPRLQLSLFNDEQKLIAQRIFEPQEYLATQTGTKLMLSRRTVNVSMELLDPGKEVTGFKFEFL
jgi:predicted Zn finger-like uncharacterized protein